MAIPTDLDGPHRRRGRTAHADADEVARVKRIQRAQRHSRMIRVLRWTLPVGAVTIAGYFVATLFFASDMGSEIASKALTKIVPANLAMNNPRYRGFNKDGGEYELKAEKANPHPKNLQLILLRKVDGQLKHPNGAVTDLTAASATYNTASEEITLHRKIDIKSSTGGWAHLRSALVETKTGIISTQLPVELGNATSTITAKEMKILQKTKELTLSGDVVATLQPTRPSAEEGKGGADGKPVTGDSAAVAAGQSSSLARIFTAGKGPIKITADRLDLDDVKKTAVFVGKVRAQQGEAELTTPELRIAYTGAPSGGLTGGAEKSEGAAAGNESHITSIVAAEPVAITQAPATHVAGKTAAFDATTQRATLDGGVTITRAPDMRITGRTAGFDDLQDVAHVDGDVVLSQGADRRATGEHAEFHTSTETAILTGVVVLTQGKNILRGRRLYMDQKAGRMELTAPPMAKSGPGRITAHFVQNAEKAKAPARTSSTGGAFTGLASFRTDPSAPVDIEAAQLEVQDRSKLAVFRGDVQIKQGDFHVRTAELNAHYTGSTGFASAGAAAASDAAQAERAQEPAAQLKRLRTPGKVVITSKNGQSATGDWSDFDLNANTVTLGGDVVLTQGRNVVKGTHLVIDLATGESVIKTDNSAAPQVSAEKPGNGWQAKGKPGRPSAVFYPQELRDAAAKSTGEGKSRAPAETPATSGWRSTTSQ